MLSHTRHLLRETDAAGPALLGILLECSQIQSSGVNMLFWARKERSLGTTLALRSSLCWAVGLLRAEETVCRAWDEAMKPRRAHRVRRLSAGAIVSHSLCQLQWGC